MKLTWSHISAVLLLIAAVTLETAASKDESNSGRYGIFRKHRRSVSNNVDDLPSSRVVTPNFLNRVKEQLSGSSGSSCPPSHTETYTEPATAPSTTLTLTLPTWSTGTPTATVILNDSRTLEPIASDNFNEDDESDYEFDSNVYSRNYDDVDDDDYENDNYLVSVKNGQRVLPRRQFDSNNDLSASFDSDVDANSFARASRQNQSNRLRLQNRMRRRAAARRRRQQRRRREQMRRRRQQRRRRNGNRRRRFIRRRGPNVRGGRTGARRPAIPGLNRVINI